VTEVTYSMIIAHPYPKSSYTIDFFHCQKPINGSVEPFISLTDALFTA
jgi:hypothetical protein